MATRRRANDDQFYIVKGYPFENDDGEQDAFFRTLQVGRRADSLFRTLEAKDGFQIEKPLFYCLCVEAEIFFDGKADRPPSPLKIPALIRYEAEGIFEDSDFAVLRDYVSLKQMRSICDVLQQFAKKQYPIKPLCVQWMSLARIAFLVHQRQHEEENFRQRSKSLAAQIDPSISESVNAFCLPPLRLDR